MNNEFLQEFLKEFDIFFEFDANKRQIEEEEVRTYLENKKISEQWENLFAQGEWI